MIIEGAVFDRLIVDSRCVLSIKNGGGKEGNGMIFGVIICL